MEFFRSLAAVRFALRSKLRAKRQRPSASDSLRSLLSVLPCEASFGQKGNVEQNILNLPYGNAVAAKPHMNRKIHYTTFMQKKKYSKA